MKVYQWDVELFQNTGTGLEPKYEWVKHHRYYDTEKKITDFDLHDIEGKRRNAVFIRTDELVESNETFFIEMDESYCHKTENPH